MKARILAIVGMAGSGKTEATNFFVENGFSKIRFGQITIDTLKERNLEVNEKNERIVREDLRKKHGMAAYATLNIPKIKELTKTTDKIILDGLYSWEEYIALKKEVPSMIVVAIYASPKTRYNRLSKREERPLTEAEAKSRDASEIENSHKAGPIVMADFTIINEDTIYSLIDQCKKILGALI
jgi:dephospho-CoA kinase